MIPSPHFHVRKNLITLMLAVCLPLNILSCHAVEDASDNTVNPPAKRILCPMKAPTFSWPNLTFLWPDLTFSCSSKKKSSVLPADQNSDLTPEREMAAEFPVRKKPSTPTHEKSLAEGTADNSPDFVIPLSSSTTGENTYEDPAPFLIAVDRKLESYVTDLTTEHKEELPYTQVAPLRLEYRQPHEKTNVMVVEDNICTQEKNRIYFGQLPESDYVIDYMMSGKEAWHKIRENNLYPDTVFLDLQMLTRCSWSVDMLQYALSYATNYKTKQGIDLSDINEMPEGIALAAALREIGYSGPVIAVTSDYNEATTEGNPLYKYRHLFQEIRFKIQKREKIPNILKKFNTRTRRSVRMPSISTSFLKSPKQSEAPKYQKTDD